jgi:molybdopterin synthase sulfur carrier subunit
MPVVFIPALLQEMTGGRTFIEVEGATVRQVIDNLERACPGIRERLLEGDRLRPHVQVAVDGAVGPLGLRERTEPTSEVHFVAAISGGM